jgi:hypothetical protein
MTWKGVTAMDFMFRNSGNFGSGTDEKEKNRLEVQLFNFFIYK